MTSPDPVILRRIATLLRSDGQLSLSWRDELVSAASCDVPGWTGPTADAFRASTERLADSCRALDGQLVNVSETLLAEATRLEDRAEHAEWAAAG